MRSCILLSLSLPLAVVAQPLQQALADVAAQHGLVGMSVVAICQGDVMDVAHTGQSDLAIGTPVNDATRYRIASISKLVTAIGLMRLWEQGAFALDDDVSGALGYLLRNPAYPNTPITYRMLLSHRGSVQDGTGYANFLGATYATVPPPSLQELLVPGGEQYTSNMWRSETPGTYFIYGNINFGIIGSLIEALSGQRFDVYMRDQVLIPMGITGSFNIQDLDQVASLATLYRNSAPQADNFGGVMPPAPNLTGYVIGSNGLYFGPQGGLRCSAVELARVAILLQQQGSVGGTTVLQPATVSELLANTWTWNGSNGDNYDGLFRSWGLGVHRVTAQAGGDVVFPGLVMYGHAGEAYGLISDLYFDPVSGFGLVFITNGFTPGNNYTTGSSSAFYTAEVDVFAALAEHAFPACVQLGVVQWEDEGALRQIERGFIWNGSGALTVTVHDTIGRVLENAAMASGTTWMPHATGPVVLWFRKPDGATMRRVLP